MGRWHRVGADEGIPEGNVSDLLVDRKRRLWVSAETGVFVRTDGATRFERVAPSLHSPGGSRIYSFLQETPGGAIWGSSQDRGLQQLAPAPVGGDPEVMPRVSESMSIADRPERRALGRPTEQRWLRSFLAPSLARSGWRARAAANDGRPLVRRRDRLAAGPRRQRMGFHGRRPGPVSPGEAESLRGGGTAGEHRPRRRRFRCVVGRVRRPRPASCRRCHARVPRDRQAGRDGVSRSHGRRLGGKPARSLANRPRPVHPGRLARCEERRGPGRHHRWRRRPVDFTRAKRRLSQER